MCRTGKANDVALSSSGVDRRFSRRTATVLLATAPVAYATRSQSRAAQALSGSIRVGYDSGNEFVALHIDAAAAAVHEAHPDAEIAVEPSSGGNFLTQLVLQLSSGRAPDVFLLPGPFLAELASAGFVAPLDDYLAGWDGWTQYPEQLKSQSVYDGVTWSVPYNYDMNFLYYRKDILQQAGLPAEWMPETVDDIVSAAVQIRDSSENVIPYALYAGANGGLSTVGQGFVPLVYAGGGRLKDEDGKWFIDSCAIRYALGYYERVYQSEGVVPQDVMTGASPESAVPAAMFEGDLGILLEGCWQYGGWLEEDPEATRAHIGYVLHPGAQPGTPFALGLSGSAWYINSGSDNRDLAWEFIAAFNSKDTQIALNAVDPHLPGRQDAATDPAFQEDPFLRAIVESVDHLVLADPDPAFRQLIPIVQNATGIVASGEATPAEALERYTSELTRVLGEENVTRESCS